MSFLSVIPLKVQVQGSSWFCKSFLALSYSGATFKVSWKLSKTMRPGVVSKGLLLLMGDQV